MCGVYLQSGYNWRGGDAPGLDTSIIAAFPATFSGYRLVHRKKLVISFPTITALVVNTVRKKRESFHTHDAKRAGKGPRSR
jgi:hypothetical protein